jgi:hypothetical protein
VKGKEKIAKTLQYTAEYEKADPKWVPSQVQLSC